MFGLTISTKKTRSLTSTGTRQPYIAPNITVNGQPLANVDKFPYLGSFISQNANIDHEITVRLAKATAAFGRLYDKVWDRKGIKLQTKLKVYKAVVIPTLLYGSETWTVYSHHANKLNHFHTVRLRKILNIKWQDKIPDTEVLTKADLLSIHSLLIKSQLRWADHVVRMPDYRLPKQLLYGELQSGKRSQGGQKKRYKDSLKVSLKACDINCDSWEQKALDRPQWRSLIFNGSKQSESKRQSSAEQKRTCEENKADDCGK